jgi:transcriptional regulator with XRE-family HTH domain
VGDAIGTSDVSIHRYENGIRPKRPEIYEKLARLFGCTIKELTDDSVDILPKDLQETTEEKKDSQKSTEEKIPVEEKNAPTEKEQKASNKKDIKKAKSADDKKAPAKAKAEQPTPAEKAKAEKPKKADSVNEKPVEDTTEKSAPEEKSSEPAPDKTAPTEFGKRLSSLRKAKNLTLAQVADKIGVTLNTYKGMEYKNTRPTDPKVYNKLAKVLGCDVEYLKEGDKRFEKKSKATSKKDDAKKVPTEAPVVEIKPAPEKMTEHKEPEVPTEAPEKKVAPVKDEIVTEQNTESQTDLEQSIPEEAVVSIEKSSATSEVIKLVSRLSVLLAGDEISQSEKDAVMVALNGAYWR